MNYWMRKIGDVAVMAVLFALLFWVVFPSYVKAVGLEVPSCECGRKLF